MAIRPEKVAWWLVIVMEEGQTSLPHHSCRYAPKWGGGDCTTVSSILAVLIISMKNVQLVFLFRSVRARMG